MARRSSLLREVDRPSAARLDSAVHSRRCGLANARGARRAITLARLLTAALIGWAAAADALTATPTASPTPRVVEIRGSVFDAAQGPGVRIVGARVEFVQNHVREFRTSDAAGDFAFTLVVPDDTSFPVWTSVNGYRPDLHVFRAGDLRQTGTLDIGLTPAPPRTTAFIYGHVYDASVGSEARIPGAQIQYKYYGSGVYPDVEETSVTDSDGLYGFMLSFGASDMVDFTIDAPGYATFRVRVGSLQLAAQQPITFGIAPLGGIVEFDPSGGTFNCSGSFDLTIRNIAPDETLVVLGISLWHGYSQGDYGTGFTWDLSHIDFPVFLESGEHISVPVSFGVGEVPSRLHVEVVSGARFDTGGGVYRAVRGGDACPSTPTPPATSTPTPTATATPQRTGDLGTREIHGRVYDSEHGVENGIAGATVSYGGPHGSGTVTSDAQGDFAFSLFLHDTDTIHIGAAAAGYDSAEVQRSGYQLWTEPAVDIGLAPIRAGGHRVWGVVTRDPYCGAEAEVRVMLESSGGDVPASRTLVLPPSNEFEFRGVADGDYILRLESDCQPSYAAPQSVFVRGADVYVPTGFDTSCPPVVAIEPMRGPPGTVVSLSGRCYYIHSGASADVYLENERVTSVRGETSGHYTTQIRIPLDAHGGWHAIHVRIPGTIHPTPIGSANFYVNDDQPPVCPGDCDGNGRVEIGELITGVGLALRTTVATCPALVRGLHGDVAIAELVSAVASALSGCAVIASPTPASPSHATFTATPLEPTPVATTTPSPSPTPIPDALALLMQNRAMWNRIGATRYRMLEGVRCYCNLAHLVSIEVLDDQIISIRDVWSGAEVAGPLPDNYRTIDGIFDLIEDAIRTQADRISVTYGPDVGAPLEVYVDYDRALQDEEIGYSISELAILSSSPP